MAGFSPEKAQEIFIIPKEFTPTTVIALEYLGEADVLPDKLKEAEKAARNRKSLPEIAFENSWNKEAKFLNE